MKRSRGHAMSHEKPKMSHEKAKMSHEKAKMSHDHSRLSHHDNPKKSNDPRLSIDERKSKFRPRADRVKVRTKLPPIETYEKDVDFRLEGLGRIIVRLERLMGSDRVRLTDAKFMTLFLQKLEAEERKAWDKRTMARKKAERLRSRDLVIHGLMEPGAEHQELYQHPVFRVNRVLKQLSNFDQNMTLGQIDHLPPIVETEPFEFDDSGAIFKSYPYHVELKNGASREEVEIEGEPSRSPTIEKVSVTDEDFVRQSTGSTSEKKSRTYQPDHEEEDEDNEEEETITSTINLPNDNEWAGEWGEEEEKQFKKIHKKTTKIPFDPLKEVVSLTALQQSYGIPPHEDLAQFAPFRSDLVDLIYLDEHNGVLQMYETAEEVINVYERENLTVDEFVIQLSKIMREGGAGGGGGATMST